MKIVVSVIAILYASLHAFAALTQIKKNKDKINDILMITGAVTVLASAVMCIFSMGFDWILAALGFASVVIAAILNGRKQGKIHIQHHIVRIAVSAALIIGFVFF